MFNVYHCEKKKEQFVVISNKSKSTKAEISLHRGGSLSNLMVNHKKIITDLEPLAYEKTYASSILFPFANRVNYGNYSFLGKNYQLDCNEKKNENALHGLVYDKKFKIVNEIINENYVEIKLLYEITNAHKGFPYSFKIELSYKLHESSLKINLNISNLGNEIFPFTVGWHPYFHIDDFNKSELIFDSKERLDSDKRNITTKISNFKTPKPWQLNNLNFDDAFIISNNKISLKTNYYTMNLTSSEKNNFLQIYTPKKTNAIAIEPMTGVSDSFNNEIGLKQLKPNNEYRIGWLLEVVS